MDGVCDGCKYCFFRFGGGKEVEGRGGCLLLGGRKKRRKEKGANTFLQGKWEMRGKRRVDTIAEF